MIPEWEWGPMDYNDNCLETAGSRVWNHALTHSPLDKMAAILQTKFSNAFFWMRSFVFWFKLHWNFDHKVPVDNKVSIGLGNGLVPSRWQTISWTKADLVHGHIYAALGGDELIEYDLLLMKVGPVTITDNFQHWFWANVQSHVRMDVWKYLFTDLTSLTS